MIWNNCKHLFKRWKLSEKETLLGTTLCYEIKGIIKFERYYTREERNTMYDQIFNLFFEYEYDWWTLSARKISYLLWVHHTIIDNILKRIKDKIKKSLSPNSIKWLYY